VSEGIILNSMAKVFTIVTPLDPVYSQSRIVASGAAASIAPGTPTKQGTAGAVAIMVDGDGTTSQVFTGIAKSTSTDTASAAGQVFVWLPIPSTVYSGFAKSATAADTQAEIDALQGKRVVFDLTTGDWTVDTGASDNVANGLLIMGGDYRTSTIYFIMRETVAWYNLTT
jgi:hypothetical protein